MSRRVYEDGCRGCEPALLDKQTGRTLPDAAPQMQAALSVFRDTTTFSERRAWHRVTCLHSRDPQDVAQAQAVAGRIAEALRALERN